MGMQQNEVGFDKSRVLILNPTSKIGGAERSLLELVSQVPKNHRHNFCIVLPNTSGPLYNKVDDLGYETNIMKFPPYEFPIPDLGGFTKFVREIDDYISSESIDTVYGNHLSLGPTLSSLKIISSEIQTVLHVRDHRSPLGLLFRTAPFQDDVVFNSEFVRDEGVLSPLFKLLFSTNIHVVYNSVDVSTAENNSKYSNSSTGNSKPDLTIGMFGRFVPWKNYEFSIQHCCQNDIYDLFDELLIVGANSGLGNEEYEAKLREIISNIDNKNKVRVLDFKENVWDYYKKCDVIIVPSKNEPFGRVPIEAGTLGIPVLVANSGGLPEIINDGETGYIFDIDRPNEFKQKIRKLLLNDSIRSKIGANLQDDVRERFSSKRYYDEMMSIICEDPN